MVTQFYRLVMDPSLNAFRELPRTTQFHFMLILSYMWSVIFSIYIGVIALAGPSIAAHTILLVGIFFTADIFRRARAGQLESVRLAKLMLILSGHYLTSRFGR